jgi:uncharacterized repeat protein (TIGR02543 family)
MIGKAIGQYRIEEKIGSGAMGVVYRARQESLNRAVALKLLPSHLALEEHALARFQREAKAIARIAHPNIVQVIDIGEDNGRHYIAMEFIEGRTLEQFLKDAGPMPVRDAVYVAAQVAAALGAAHVQGIIHRDVKPSNILITDKLFAKLTDFGVAALSEGGDDNRLTMTMAAVGTPYYMSPEQVRGRDALDGASDVYAAGVLLYEMLAGRHPFADSTPTEAMIQQVSEPYPPLRRYRDGVPEELISVLERCLSKEKGARYASGQALFEALDKVRLRLDFETLGAEPPAGSYHVDATGTGFFYVDPAAKETWRRKATIKRVAREAWAQLTDPHRKERHKLGQLYAASMASRESMKSLETHIEELKRRHAHHEKKASEARQLAQEHVSAGRGDEVGDASEQESFHTKLALDYEQQIDRAGRDASLHREAYNRLKKEHTTAADSLALLDSKATGKGRCIPVGPEDAKLSGQGRRLIQAGSCLMFACLLLACFAVYAFQFSGESSEKETGKLTKSALSVGNSATLTVRFDAQGGTVSPGTTEVAYNSAYGTLPVPTRAGYAFDGWWTEFEGSGTQVTATTKMTITTPHALHAKWTASSLAVGLSAHYRFEGNAEDETGRHNGIAFGCTYGAGMSGQAVYFDGIDDRIDAGVARDIMNSPQVSISYWINWSGSSYCAVSTYDGGNHESGDFLHYPPTPQVLRVQCGTGPSVGFGADFTGMFESNAWAHVCIVIDTTQVNSEDKIKYYLNGEQKALAAMLYDSSALGANIGDTAKLLRFGAVIGSPTTYMAGQLDEIRIYRRVLSATEVQELYALDLKTVVVTFDAQGGSVAPGTAEVTYNSAYGTLPVPIRVGYAFGGWWTGGGGSGTQVTVTTKLTITMAQTLYAKWTANRLASGLLAHYSFAKDEGGRVSDLSGMKRDGKVVNAEWTADGRIGGAMRFGPDVSYIEASDAGLPMGDAARSIAFWMKLGANRNLSNPLVYGTLRHNQNFSLGMDWRLGRNSICVGQHGSVNVASKKFETGRWYHIVYTYGGAADHRFYIDGVEDPLAVREIRSPLGTASSGSLYLGLQAGVDRANTFDGWLDDVMIYDRVLEPAEVRLLFERR